MELQHQSFRSQRPLILELRQGQVEVLLDQIKEILALRRPPKERK